MSIDVHLERRPSKLWWDRPSLKESQAARNVLSYSDLRIERPVWNREDRLGPVPSGNPDVDVVSPRDGGDAAPDAVSRAPPRTLATDEVHQLEASQVILQRRRGQFQSSGELLHTCWLPRDLGEDPPSLVVHQDFHELGEALLGEPTRAAPPA